MRANPGGILAPEEVLGRDRLISAVWHALKSQSVVLTSERRIGKTSVIRKMCEQISPDQIFAVLRDIEGLRTPEEFVEAVYSDVEGQLGKVDRAKMGLWRLMEKLGGTQIVDVKLPAIRVHWKSLLMTLFDDLFQTEARDVIFFWDELPLFIFNVARSSGDDVAMELLDVLRALRQRHKRLRMVFTGSVGIHQVVSNLRRRGYANDPTNDMAIIDVPPLDPPDGKSLAEQLLAGENLLVAEPLGELGQAASESVGHIPYYIHVLVSRLRSREVTITADVIKRERDLMIQDPNDPAHFCYYEDRLSTYYTASDAQTALRTLDALCIADAAVPQSRLLNLVRHHIEDVNEDEFRQVLTLLMKDHYLQRDHNGHYSFRYSLIQYWWHYSRGKQ